MIAGGTGETLQLSTATVVTVAELVNMWDLTAEQDLRCNMVWLFTGITPMLQIIRQVFKDPDDKTDIWMIFANQVGDLLIASDWSSANYSVAKSQMLDGTEDRPQHLLRAFWLELNSCSEACFPYVRFCMRIRRRNNITLLVVASHLHRVHKFKVVDMCIVSVRTTHMRKSRSSSSVSARG